MAKFSFHLEPVLRHRAEKASTAEQALAMAHNEYHRRLSILENTRQRLEDAYNLVEEEKDPLDVVYLSYYRASLSTKIDAQEHEARIAEKTVERKRNVAIKARQDRQVMEKLKDKHYSNYQFEESMREQKEIDELALYAYMRGNF